MCARTAWVADARRRQNTADGAFSRHSGTSASHPASAKQTQTARDARCRGAPRATETLGRRGKSSKEGRPLHWTACMAAAHRGGRAYTRTGLATVGLVASFAALPVAAEAALTIQPNAPALGFPASVDDTVGAFSLTSCQDNSGFCVETPAPNPTQPLSVPDNYTPDGEAFYQIAEATVPNAGIGLARFALEQAFTTADPVAGQQIMFGRIRFRFQGLKPGTKYRMTHPYGVDEIVADGGGIINSTEDLGCLGPPCDFTAAHYGRIASFLQWDPTVAPGRTSGPHPRAPAVLFRGAATGPPPPRPPATSATSPGRKRSSGGPPARTSCASRSSTRRARSPASSARPTRSWCRASSRARRRPRRRSSSLTASR